MNCRKIISLFQIFIMSIHYQTIYADLLKDKPEEVEFSQLPELDSFDLSGKIAILKTYLRWSRMRGKRNYILFYIFQLEKWVFIGNLRWEEAGLTPYYYKVALRTYLIFEKDFSQIMRTKNTTLRDMQHITRKELDDLIELT